MKTLFFTVFAALLFVSHPVQSQKMYIDVHHLGAGKVTYAAVLEAHKKDLATQDKYGVHFIKFWVDESRGDVYCLSTASDSTAIIKTHGEAHGLLPDRIELVTDGSEAAMKGKQNLWLDIHDLGPGKVTARDVAGAHVKDLAVQGKYGVNLINYWVDEKQGIVMCLAEAKDSTDLIKTHREAHGLLPDYVMEVKQGQ